LLAAVAAHQADAIPGAIVGALRDGPPGTIAVR
jgi:hypothetical protein